jgi:putative membrane protein
VKQLLSTAAVLLSLAVPALSQSGAPGGRAPALLAADRTFVVTVLKNGAAEAELGKLAIQKATRADVKQFAQRMVDDHTKAGDKLKMLAQAKGIAIPGDIDPKAKALHDQLSKLSGEGFDRRYMEAMLADHRQAADEFRRELTNGRDNDIKAFAADTLPTIEEHLNMAIASNKLPIGTSGGNRPGPAIEHPDAIRDSKGNDKSKTTDRK